MPDTAVPASEDEAGREAFAALLRERIPDYPARGSLEAFAARCGGKITGPQIGQYARGELAPRLDTLKLLCKGMGIPASYGFAVLIGQEPVEKAPPPDDLREIEAHLNRAIDLINRLVIRSTNASHAPRRRPRTRTHDTNIGGIDSPIDHNDDYGYQEIYQKHLRVNNYRLDAASA